MKRLSIIAIVVASIMLLMLAIPAIAQEDVIEETEVVSQIALINAENLVGEISPMTYDIVFFSKFGSGKVK